MKITFIYPRFEKFLSTNRDVDRGLVDYYLGDFTTPPSLGIPIMASWTPDDIDIELLDDNSGDIINYNDHTDLVAINCFTPQATRAFEIADNYRAAGKKVIMGGFFPSFMVDECLKHADSVNIGEVEPTWLTIIEDAKRGELKPIYKGGNRFDISKMKIPRRDIFYSKNNYTWEEDLVQITRGCSYTCAMCAIPEHMGHRMRFRPIEHVVEEIKTLKYENVYLADDTLFFPQRKIVDYTTELFKQLEPLNKKYFVASTMALKTDTAFMDLAARAGVSNFYCTMNVDPVSIKALNGDKVAVQQLVDLVNILEDRNIRFFGSFAIGRDWDDTSIADRVLDLYHKANIKTSEFFLFTPYPGSKQWDRLDRQGRIFDKEWNHYNGAHLVAEHPTMGRDELYGQFVKVWNEFFKIQKDRNAKDLEPLTYSEGRESVGIPLQESGVKNQAVITGIGVYSPIGNSIEAISDSLKSGKTGIATATKIDGSKFRTDQVGEIKEFDKSEYLSQDEITEYDDEYLQYAISAARKALKNAEIDNIDEGTALVLATCNGGLRSAESEYAWKHGKADKPFDDKMNLQAQYYGFGKAISAALGVKGEVWLVTTACSSGTAATGIAQMVINKGYSKRVILIGSDMLCEANVAGFNSLKAVSTACTAPFSNPVGLNVGEATVCWVVEEMESALLRRAKCLAKLAGYATTSDAYHPTTPDPRGDGVARTLKSALENSNVEIGSLGCINSHGTGTDANDRAESRGIVKFMGENSIPVISQKSFTGHCMGTTGLLEATGNIVGMNSNFIPPTINFTEPRAGCTLDYVPNKKRDLKYDSFISANYAFGGNNAAIVVTKWDKDIGKVNNLNRRVVITGTATVTSLGVGSENLLKSLAKKERKIISASNIINSNLEAKKAGLVSEVDFKSIDRRVDFNAMNPISKFATAASRLALNDAGLKINRRNAEDAGIAMGVCNGPNEMGHMDSIFADGGTGADINSFSNITANSTAGWVSNALTLKGTNITLSPGHHAGISALAYAYDMVSEERCKYMLASASDEVYEQTFFNYDLMDWLYTGVDEDNYKFNSQESKKKVLGEGAASLLLETLDSARERNAEILAEVLAYGMSQDAVEFSKPSTSSEGVLRAIKIALNRSNLTMAEIDLVGWAPQGNCQDNKITAVIKDIPMVTTIFNTGYIESASILVTVAAILESLKTDNKLWPQIGGYNQLDNLKLSKEPQNILLVGSSDVGYNFAVVLRNGNCL